MYTLYYSLGACSFAIHALLYALDVPFDTIKVDIKKGDNFTPKYLAINPRGQVPVLVINQTLKLRESSVIAIHLLDHHKNSLLPNSQIERLKTLEWLGFYNSTLHQAYSAYFLMSKNIKDENVRNQACILVTKRINFLWKEVEQHLGKNNYLAGDQLTIADIFHAVIANWKTVLNHHVEIGKNAIRLGNEISNLSYFKRALSAENIIYNI